MSVFPIRIVGRNPANVPTLLKSERLSRDLCRLAVPIPIEFEVKQGDLLLSASSVLVQVFDASASDDQAKSDSEAGDFGVLKPVSDGDFAGTASEKESSVETSNCLLEEA